MPLVLIILGVGMMLLAWQNNQGAFIEQVGEDFAGGFFVWFAAIVMLSALSYVPALKGFSRAMIGLVILVIVLKNGTGLFSRLQSLGETSNIQADNAAPEPTVSIAQSSGGTTDGFENNLNSFLGA